jgi:hypothetical protein
VSPRTTPAMARLTRRSAISSSGIGIYQRRRVASHGPSP